jgi:ParB-like chromosome segregation protein Spo0J
MGKDDLVRRQSAGGLKAKGRSRREFAANLAKTANSGWKMRNDVLPTLQIESYPTSALNSHSQRLRKSDTVHIREIANSISAFGFNIPLVVGKSNVVTDGESRLEAARLLGLSSVPCIGVDHLNENDQRFLRLAVNRLAEKGSWAD